MYSDWNQVIGATGFFYKKPTLIAIRENHDDIGNWINFVRLFGVGQWGRESNRSFRGSQSERSGAEDETHQGDSGEILPTGPKLSNVHTTGGANIGHWWSATKGSLSNSIVYQYGSVLLWLVGRIRLSVTVGDWPVSIHELHQVQEKYDPMGKRTNDDQPVHRLRLWIQQMPPNENESNLERRNGPISVQQSNSQVKTLFPSFFYLSWYCLFFTSLSGTIFFGEKNKNSNHSVWRKWGVSSDRRSGNKRETNQLESIYKRGSSFRFHFRRHQRMANFRWGFSLQGFADKVARIYQFGNIHTL